MIHPHLDIGLDSASACGTDHIEDVLKQELLEVIAGHAPAADEPIPG
jgi:hypothetical protein